MPIPCAIAQIILIKQIKLTEKAVIGHKSVKFLHDAHKLNTQSKGFGSITGEERNGKEKVQDIYQVFNFLIDRKQKNPTFTKEKSRNLTHKRKTFLPDKYLWKIILTIRYTGKHWSLL